MRADEGRGGEAGAVPGAGKPRRLVRRAGRSIRTRWDILLVIAVGGAFGSLLRWLLGQLVSAPRGEFAWATFLENVSGAFAMGVLIVFLIDVWPPSRYLRPFLGVGVLGGYTTFSTYVLDAGEIMLAGRPLVAAGYIFSTLILGLSAVWAGMALARAAVAVARRRALHHLEPREPQPSKSRSGRKS